MAGIAAILVARLIFAGAFLIAAVFKFLGMDATAAAIASLGFPFPLYLAWLSAMCEVALVIAFLTGAFFSEAAILAGIYAVFLAFTFYGPSQWSDPTKFGFFVNHFTFLAGLLFAAAHGPGDTLALRWSLGRRRAAVA